MYNRFEQLLQKNNVTAYRVAKETGIAQTTFSDWKKGKSSPKVEKLSKIADYFGVSIEYFTKTDSELFDKVTPKESLYITQDIADRIKDQVKKQGTTMRTLLNECGLNINAVSQFAKGKQLSCVSLAKIADYLDCSVDYLLGRTADPESHKQKGPVLMVENEPRYLVRRAGRDGILSEEYLTKEEIDKMNEYIDSLEDADF